MDGMSESSLRAILRRETAKVHDVLDTAMAGSAVADDASYGRFLAFQFSSRQPVEAWMERAMKPADIPPPQAPLIARDLAALGCDLPRCGTFDMPQGADPLGAVWALAGSSLGNRAMLVRRRKAGLGAPNAFLSDGAMPAFFTALKPRLEIAVDTETAMKAVAGARAVFDAFLAQLEPERCAA